MRLSLPVHLRASGDINVKKPGRPSSTRFIFKPQAYEMAFSAWFVTVFASGMQNDEVVDELHIAFLEGHFYRYTRAITEFV